MRNRFILRNLTVFLVVTLFAVAIQDTKTLQQYRDINPTEYKPEESREFIRDKRATKKLGFFRTLFSVIYDQYNDTKNTINTVNQLVNDNFLPENAPITTTTMSSDPNATTTEAPYKITRTEFNRIIRRNLRGLVRLFNIEFNEALQQSAVTKKQLKKNASIEFSKYL
ncbi:uncharacterized protein LOC109608926 [Aethina tumida]|uniref:uncharacterized protein LOC109608926 n=1 Tax=Aethina tumida TaxID=116153 RepID=UPI00096AF6B0|nr:uncharacterized protein LOC109608926 [Aethina tumida]XP_049825672.1 uncharacterized protein LOC109608926 [Aethina tumida]XP_049825673.1 uncharacterized protein LOC109608926 [Aethina tumida]XP_049825674.1 uncharacterized protein LOC109608926 [Aethina tumida]